MKQRHMERWTRWEDVPLILNTEEAAVLLTLSVRTMEGRRLRGEPPAWRRLGQSRKGKVVYLKKDVLEFLGQTNKTDTLSEPALIEDDQARSGR